MRIATVIAVLGCLLSLACYDERQLKHIADEARAQGRAAGYQAGKDEAYPAAFDGAKKAAYRSTVYDLYMSGQFVRNGNYLIVAVTISILLGFLLQYALFHVARSLGFARIVLTGLLAAALAAGCIDVEKIRKDAYKEGFDAGYTAGLHDGESEGSADGYRNGVQAAHAAAANGDAWQLYVVPAAGALGVGALGGILLQYAVLWYCRRWRAAFWMVLFVPGLTRGERTSRPH